MVAIQVITESNARIASSLPAGLVAVFAELKALNPGGEYHYIRNGSSLLENVDQACQYIKEREPVTNLLFLSCGTLITGKQTSEGLNYPMALAHYSRARFIVNLLPQLRKAPSLRRVVTVGAGTKEGTIFPDDFQANILGVLSFRGHLTSMITLSLAAVAWQAPEVSFVHDYPGFVKTGLPRELTGVAASVSKVVFAPLMAVLQIPIEETGERQLYLATTARFPPRGGSGAEGVAVEEGVSASAGFDGTPAGGVYSVDYEAEGPGQKVEETLQNYKKSGMGEKVWNHTEEEFVRITGKLAI
ncbi:hypothetical protein LQW54_006569 [Pestalotiopsis sp. IQ-011]